MSNRAEQRAAAIAGSQVGGNKYPYLEQPGTYELTIKNVQDFVTRKQKPVFIAECQVLEHIAAEGETPVPKGSMRTWWQNQHFDGAEKFVKRFILAVAQAAAFRTLVAGNADKNIKQHTKEEAFDVVRQFGEDKVTPQTVMSVIGDDSVARELRISARVDINGKGFAEVTWLPPFECERVKALAAEAA